MTVYRPSIIIGDSRTGFTSAYNGLYLVLKLVHTLASRVSLGSTAAEALLRMLDVKGIECKNLVPVDWVSAALTALVNRPECHGATYHLTARRPLPLVRIARVFQTAVESYSTLAEESAAERLDGEWFESSFQQQMTTYQAYWGHDPVFDSTQTIAALPDVPCPEIDEQTLLGMAQFAIKTNFGKPKPRSIKPEFDVAGHLEDLLQRRQTVTQRSRDEHWLGLQVDGPGGGQWKLLLERGRPIAAERGLSPKCSATFLLDSSTFRQLALRQLPVAHALATGRLVIEGNGLSTPEFAAVMEAVVVGTPPAYRSAG